MEFRAKDKYFDLENKFAVMGILNVTPDSFSDGGMYNDPEKALARCLKMVDEGAGMIDVGGESSRPGSKKISACEELERIIPVIRKIRENSNVCISVDTYKSEVAEAALSEGADMVNCIFGTQVQESVLSTVLRHSSGLCLMHIRGTPENMQDSTEYDDIVSEVFFSLESSYDKAAGYGIAGSSIMIDPGIGFGKSAEGNLKLLGNLKQFTNIGCPVLIGTSRKSFIGTILGKEPHDRLSGTLASNVTAYLEGARIFRVHDVKENYEALETARRIYEQKTAV